MSAIEGLDGHQLVNEMGRDRPTHFFPAIQRTPTPSPSPTTTRLVSPPPSPPSPSTAPTTTMQFNANNATAQEETTNVAVPPPPSPQTIVETTATVRRRRPISLATHVDDSMAIQRRTLDVLLAHRSQNDEIIRLLHLLVNK